jgi:hypothetical protein
VLAIFVARGSQRHLSPACRRHAEYAFQWALATTDITISEPQPTGVMAAIMAVTQGGRLRRRAPARAPGNQRLRSTAVYAPCPPKF